MALLKSDEGISRQLQWYLFSLRVYVPIKRQYERKYNNNLNHDHYDETSFKFPEYSRLFKYYNVISNLALGWVFLKYFFPNLFNQLHKQLFYLLINSWSSQEIQADLYCYSFGGFVVHYEQSDELTGIIFASYHIGWRLAQVALERPFSLGLVLFLLQPRDEIEKFIWKLELANESIERAQRSQKRLSIAYRSKTSTGFGLNYGQLSQRERLLCDVMCFKVIFVEEDQKDDLRPPIYQAPQRVFYKVRANRTLEAHQRLVEWLANATWKCSLVFLALLITFLLYILIVVSLNQHRYLKQFPGCDEQLGKSFKNDEVQYWSLPPLTGHRWTAMLADLLVNIVVWLESGMILFYALTFAAYINEDLLCHWDHLEKKIELISSESKHIRYLFNDTLFKQRILRPFHERVYEFQVELADFYRQIQQVDLLISDVITHALLIWLSFFGLMSYKLAIVWASSRDSQFALILIMISAIGFLCYYLASVSLLTLQGRCHSAYLQLSSLMAHDQSQYKRNFCTLIRYYTEKNRTCYTWFQQVPFTSTNYLSVVGWSFTGFLILDNVYNRLQVTTGK